MNEAHEQHILGGLMQSGYD